MKYNKFYKVMLAYYHINGNRKQKHKALVKAQKKFKIEKHKERGQGNAKIHWRRNWRKIYYAEQGKIK